ncbi:MAG: helix-turn-helix domain-containing protein [Eubacterium sp.]|nr:helix-turn-helix domain-containing protein [Eubacterium sp.]
MYQMTEDKAVAAVPDGCIDLVFEYAPEGINAKVCGTVFECKKTFFRYGCTYFGVRFLPGVQPRLFDVPQASLIDCETDLRLLGDCEALLACMAEQTDFSGRIEAFLKIYGGAAPKEGAALDSCKGRLAAEALQEIYRSGGCVTVKALEDYSGYSSRYINKAFHEAVGYSPKTLCKIVKFQRVLCHMNDVAALGRAGEERLTDAALDFGYYDQPQLIRDFKKYTHMTPRAYEQMVLGAKYNQHLIEEKIL